MTQRAKRAFFRNLSYVLSTELATAALIFVALLFDNASFRKHSQLASHAEAKAGRMVQESQDAFSETGVMALAGIQIVSQEVSTLIRGNQADSQKSGTLMRIRALLVSPLDPPPRSLQPRLPGTRHTTPELKKVRPHSKVMRI